jgi:hypothetical protein
MGPDRLMKGRDLLPVKSLAWIAKKDFLLTGVIKSYQETSALIKR